MRDRVDLGLAQGIGLRFAARFRHGFRKIGEQNRKPQPQGDLNTKKDASPAGDRVLDNEYCGQCRTDFDHKHHRIFCDLHRVEFYERLFRRTSHDLRIE